MGLTRVKGGGIQPTILDPIQNLYTGSTVVFTVTVASKDTTHRYNGQGSSNGYKIDGKFAPFLVLTPGVTYKFDQADGSNSGHPLRFYKDAAKVTAYTTNVTTNGTAGSSGAYTQIVTGDATPTILYYQCSAHGFMGNAVQTNGLASSVPDDGAITTAKLADDAVTDAKLANSINSAIAANTAKTSNATHTGEVTGATSLTITNNAVTTPKIADDAVTEAKLANSINSAIAANTAKDLTALSASNLTSGTVPDARFPATLPAVSGANLTNLPAGGKVHNLVMNGNFKLAQRGTSHNSSGYRTVDRWQMQAGGANATLTQSQYSAISGTSPYAEGHHQAFRIDNAGQNANTQGYVYFVHHIEAQDVVNSNWNFKSSSSYATLSFWIRGSVTQTYLVTIQSGDGTTREWNNLVSLTANQWTKVTITIPGDSNITINDDNGIGLSLYFYAYLGGHYTSTGSVNQWVNHAGYTSRPDMGTSWWTTSNSSFMLTGVQFEAGNSASDYAHESFVETLNKCKRYFHVLAHTNYVFLGLGMQYYSSSIFIDAGPIDMRVTPTFIAKQGSSGAYTYEKLFGNSAQYINAIALDGKTTRERCILNINGDASRQGQAVRISTHYHILSNNEPHVALDAELT